RLACASSLHDALPIFLDSADEAEGALLDQVEEGETLIAVVLGDRNHQAQVRLDHPLLRGAVAALDPLRELGLLCGREQRMIQSKDRKSTRLNSSHRTI